MQLSKFISILETHPNKALSYDYDNEFKVLPFSHMTEIKNVSIESIDCGGSKNNWHETVVQLWSGVANDDGHRVDSTKLLSIIEKVMTLMPLELDSELLIEYGDVEHVVAQYNVTLKQVTDSTILFNLNGVLSQCKGLSNANSCCSTNDAQCCA